MRTQADHTLRNLSKSKLLAFRQCPRRLWLEIHKPELREDSPGTESSFEIGRSVGEIARRIYDPKGKGTLIDAQAEGFAEALKRSTALLETSQPLFEAGFAAEGGLAFADVMLPIKGRDRLKWRIVEVKSATKVKDYHSDDAALQAFVAKAAGVPLASISVAHVDSKWTYPGDDDYDGLLREQDVSEEAFGRAAEVEEWLKEAHAIAARRTAPKKSTGNHCSTPFECGFTAYCKGLEPQAKYSFEVLPRVSRKIRAFANEKKTIELKDIPDALLNDLQLRVKKHTLAGKIYFDAGGAAAELSKHKLPVLFLDFETISFAVPIWKGTRPYQQIPFQFSVHRLTQAGALEHKAFLRIDGSDPSQAFAEALVKSCGGAGSVFVYNASFERARISELAIRFPRLSNSLMHINSRIVDLMPVAQRYYYHPDQEGSWSLKAVLPAIVPDLHYDGLDGVQDGRMAMTAFLEAIHPATSPKRRIELGAQLLEYCKLDTYAMVRIWQVFAGRTRLQIRPTPGEVAHCS